MSSFENVNFEKMTLLFYLYLGIKLCLWFQFSTILIKIIFFTLYVKEIIITIWDAELIFCTGLKSSGNPGGSYGGQGGLLFYVGATGG